MTTISGDRDNAGWQKLDIDCKDYLPVSISFTDNPRIIMSAERQSNYPGGRLLQYHIDLDPPRKSSAPGIPGKLRAVPLSEIDRAVVSKDGQWVVIIAGTGVTVRNRTTDEVVEVAEHTSGVPVHAVDISPDSTKFATGSQDKTVRVFSINTGRLLFKLSQHENSVLGVKFSPNGNFLATAAFRDFIRVWHVCEYYTPRWTSKDIVFGPTVNNDAAVQSSTCIPLGCSNLGDRAFTISSGSVIIFQSSLPTSYSSYYGGSSKNAADASMLFRDSVPSSDNSNIYALVTDGRIIACAAGSSLSFWDTISLSKIGPTINFQSPVISLALSHDSNHLACGTDKKITIYPLRDILPLHVIVDPTSHLPFIRVEYRDFEPWVKQDWNSVCKVPLSSEYDEYYPSQVNQSLKQAHLQDWQAALGHARSSLTTEPSIIGHIALARALVGQGKQEPAFEAFDAVFYTCRADENRPLMLIKAILLFLSGKRENAVTRVKDLVSIADDSEKYNYLQVLGNMYLIQGDWKEAFESFERARTHSFYRRGHLLLTILLIFGSSFEEREIILRHPLRKAGLRIS